MNDTPSTPRTDVGELIAVDPIGDMPTLPPELALTTLGRYLQAREIYDAEPARRDHFARLDAPAAELVTLEGQPLHADPFE